MSSSGFQESVRRRAPVPKADCALAQAVEEVGDRWSLLILREAFYGVMRYDDIRADLGIPRSVLTDRLSKLVELGMLKKSPYQEAGDRRRFGYTLTSKGRGLAFTLIALTHWSEAYILKASGPIDIVDNADGQSLHLALVNERGAIVPAERATTKVR